MPKSILFLCTGNSCRSQMAEGFGKAIAPSGTAIHSAGMSPSYLNPQAVQVMAEKQIDISAQYPKGLEDIPLDEIDLLITLCGDARDRCPTLPGKVAHLHWPIDDPYYATGTEAQIMETFRRVRDEIEANLQALFSGDQAGGQAASQGREEA